MSVLSDPGGNVPQYPLPSSSISQNYSEETVTGLLKDSFTVTKKLDTNYKSAVEKPVQ